MEAIGQTAETMDEQIKNLSFKLLRNAADIDPEVCFYCINNINQ